MRPSQHDERIWMQTYLASCLYMVNLGQPKVNLSQKPSWVLRVGSQATKKVVVLVVVNHVATKTSFNCHTISIVE
jgi:hypothetical protein